MEQPAHEPALSKCLVRILGPISFREGIGTRPVPGVRRKAVLAALALRMGEVIDVSDLIETTWAGDAPRTGINTLQKHVSFLRREHPSGATIAARAGVYVLQTPAGADAS